MIFINFQAWAQAARLEVAISTTTVSSNEPFQYQISSDCGCNILPPDMSAFDILDKQQSQFNSSNYINGVSSKSCTTTLTFTLKAREKGKINIGKAKAECKGSSKDSRAINIIVLDADQVYSANEGVVKYYYKIESNKKSVFVGEPFVVSFYLYTERLPQDIAVIVPGNALGLWQQSLYDETAPGHIFPRGHIDVKGKEYHVIELKKEVCFADKPGTLHIDSYFGRAVEEYGFFETNYMEGYSNTLDIMVKELPVEKPEDYYGMAGSFEMTHEISETSVNANHAVEMKVKVEGGGNFHLFKDPEFYFPKDSILVNDPEIKESYEYTEEGIVGSLEYTYIITPTKKGEYLILPYSFAYFDWNEGKMKSVTTDDFVLTVSKGKSPVIVQSTNGNDDFMVETDIRYIHDSDFSLFSFEDIYFGRLSYWLTLMTPFSFVFVFFLIKRRKSKETKEYKALQEQKMIKRYTVKSIQKIKGVESKDALKKLKFSLEEYLMSTLTVGKSSLSKQNIVQMLTKKAVSSETKLAFVAIWDRIEMAQYAPMLMENVSELVDQTEELIQSLNKQL